MTGKSAIVTTTSCKRLKLLHAEKGSAERDDDPEAMARVRRSSPSMCGRVAGDDRAPPG
jgi:hypothetical protein